MKNLSAKVKAIYDLLRNRPTAQDENGTYCTYPIKELAMDCAANEKTVRRSLKELEDKKYIFCHTQRRQAQKIYFVHSNSENVHSNSENVHSNSENVHSNSENVHSNSENVHSRDENVHSNSENVHSNSENVHSNSENVHSNSENVHSIKKSSQTS